MAKQSKPPTPMPHRGQHPGMPKSVTEAQKMHSETMQRLSKSGKDRGRRHVEKVKAGG